LFVRYGEACPDDPMPMAYWHEGPGPKLERLMEQALKDGRPLTPEDLCKAQGMTMPPPGAFV